MVEETKLLNLFDNSTNSADFAPLAARMRPRTFDEFIGQEHLTSPKAAFRIAVEASKAGSLLFWGPPGVGKTTLSELVAAASKSEFRKLSAVSSGVADLRAVIEEARRKRQLGFRTLLFVDEIHRFNKGQQDAILPVVEDGTVTLIGATTENPSFEVNSALVSRCRVYVLNALTDDQIGQVLDQALQDKERGLARSVELADQAKAAIVNLSNGDARSSLNMLELCASVAEANDTKEIDLETVKSVVQRRSIVYDKSGEMHYDLISALHKSIRGSDPDASLYWFARMLAGGEDPMFLARRLVRMASEDIGLADPQALHQAIAAKDAYHFLGSPEGELALAQVVVYLAAAPKSNRVYRAFSAATREVEATRNDPVPLHLRNAPTRLMKTLGYGEDYQYAHNFEGGVVKQQNLPDQLAGKKFYEPTNRGFEVKIQQRLSDWKRQLDEREEADDRP